MDASSPRWFRTVTISCGLLLLYICFWGIFGNCLSVLVFLRRGFRHLSINLLLAALSIADTCLLLISLFVFTPSTLIILVTSEYTALRLYALAPHLYPFSIIIHCISIWLLILITFERWVAVCRPFKVTVYCTTRRALLAILLVVVLSFAFNFVRFWEFRVDFNNDSIEPKILLKNVSAYVFWYERVASQLVIYVLPLGTLLTFNWLVTVHLNRASRTRVSMHLKMTKSDRTTTRMLTMVVLVFLCCHSMSFFIQFVCSLNDAVSTSHVGMALSDVSNLLVALNSATTFMFYLKFSTRYRTAVKLLYTSLVCSEQTHVYQEQLEKSCMSRGPSRRYRRILRTSQSPVSKSQTGSSFSNISQWDHYHHHQAPLLEDRRRHSSNPRNEKIHHPTRQRANTGDTATLRVSLQVDVHCQVTEF